MYAIKSLAEVRIGRLRPHEIDALIGLIDQIAGWRDFRALSKSDRRRFVETDCNGIMPSVLLQLLNSKYVQDKYREEYNKTVYVNERDRQMVIAGLIIASIGFDAPLSFLSDIFEQDFASVLKRMSTQTAGLRLVRVNGSVVNTIPAIGARNLLRSVVETRHVVNTTIFIVEKGKKRMSTSRWVTLQRMHSRGGGLKRLIDDSLKIGKLNFLRAVLWQLCGQAQNFLVI